MKTVGRLWAERSFAATITILTMSWLVWRATSIDGESIGAIVLYLFELYAGFCIVAAAVTSVASAPQKAGIDAVGRLRLASAAAGTGRL